MSIIIFKYYDQDQYPALILIPRDEFRGYSFNTGGGPDTDHYSIWIDVTPQLDKSWYVPLWGDKSTPSSELPEDDELVRTVGIRMAADLDPSAPDIDITWSWNLKKKKWDREEKRG